MSIHAACRALALVLVLAAPLADAAPPDATDRLRLVPGLDIVSAVYGGISSKGEIISDYDFTGTIMRVARDYDPKDIVTDPRDITITYSLSAPAKSRGTRTISAFDWQRSRRYSMFWFNGESGPKWMHVSLVVSDVMYGDIKTKKRTEFHVDGPNPTRWLDLDGVEQLALLVVKAYLVKTHAIAAARITTSGKGMSQPVADDATPEGRARNRRVVFRTR